MCAEISKYRKMTKKTYTTELSTQTTTRKLKKEKNIRDRTHLLAQPDKTIYKNEHRKKFY